MRKMTMNRLAALAVALMLVALVPMGALAEDINITTPTDLAPVVTEELNETENASNVTETETEEVIEEAAPQGTVRILLMNEGPLYYGDEVHLLADVDNVEDEHTLTWQIKVDIDKWENVAVGRNYRFILTPENASLEYRVIVNVAE